jgi:hypothetical protein
MLYPEDWIHMKVEVVRFFRPLVTIYQTRDITSQKIYNNLKFIKFDKYVSFNRPTFPNYATVMFRKIQCKLTLHKSELSVCVYSRTPLNRTLFIRIANYPDQLAPSGKFVEISTKLTCLEITGYRIKYSTVLWLLDLQIRRGRNV